MVEISYEAKFFVERPYDEIYAHLDRYRESRQGSADQLSRNSEFTITARSAH